MSLKNVFLLSVCFTAHVHAMAPDGDRPSLLSRMTAAARYGVGRAAYGLGRATGALTRLFG